jgi:hypothetical protein
MSRPMRVWVAVMVLGICLGIVLFFTGDGGRRIANDIWRIETGIGLAVWFVVVVRREQRRR